MLNRALFFVLVFVFSVLFSIVLTSLGEEGLAYVLLIHFIRLFILHASIGCSFSSFSWCQELASACDCGIPWTLLLTFYMMVINVTDIT